METKLLLGVGVCGTIASCVSSIIGFGLEANSPKLLKVSLPSEEYPTISSWYGGALTGNQELDGYIEKNKREE